MMVTALISSISKKRGETLLLFSLLLFGACSNKVELKKEKLEDSLEVLTGLKNNDKKAVQTDAGPTNNQGKYFIDVTSEYGLDGVQSVQNYAVDFDGDGHTDLVFLPDDYSVPEFYKFYPTEKKFKKIDSPFEESIRANFLLFLFDAKKPMPDLLMATLSRRTDILQLPFRYFEAKKVANGSIQYIEKEGMFPAGMFPVSSVVPLDYNLDGKIDLFVSNWMDSKNGKTTAVRDILLTNTDEGFKNTSQLLEGENEFSRDLDIYPNAYPSTSASICDFNYDHYPDILVTTSNGYPNKLWMNIEKSGHRSFDERGKKSGFAHDDIGTFDQRGGGFSLYSLCGDYNNDGIMDIVLGELFHSWENESKDRSSVLSGKSNYPEFFRTPYSVEYDSISWGQSDKRGVWIDYNNDGLVDFLVENTGFPPYTRVVAFKQESNHAYTDVASELGINVLNPSGIITLDFNRDGLTDILMGNTNNRNTHLKTRVFLFKNVTDIGTNRAVRIYLRGKEANHHGIGATLKLKTKKTTQTKFVQYSYSSTPSQNEEGTHFGIGEDELGSIEVLWPIVKNGKALKKNYNLSKFKFSNFLELTLCEDGTIKTGKKSCR